MKAHLHAEDHPKAAVSTKNLVIAFALNACFSIIEFFGGWWTNSVAILSDALHDMGDAAAIGLAWWLQVRSTRRASDDYTFGYQRFSLLGALISGVILLFGSIVIVREALLRLAEPSAPDAQGMLWIAGLAIVVNSYAAWRLQHGASMNEKMLSWHMLEDVLGWVAVGIVSLVLMWRPDWTFLDPLLSIGIAALILWNVVRRLRETLAIFLQAKPTSIPLDHIKQKVLAVPHVHSIHACRVWSLDGERNVFSIHVVLDGLQTVDEVAPVKAAILKVLEPHGFYDITIETEFTL